RTEYGAGGVLPLRGAFAEPTVVGEVEQEVGVGFHVMPREVWEDVFKTNQHRGLHFRIGELKRHRSPALRETAGARCEPFEEWQPAHQRDVFTEDNQAMLVILGDELARRTYEEAAVVIIRFGRGGRARSRLSVVGTDDHPD